MQFVILILLFCAFHGSISLSSSSPLPLRILLYFCSYLSFSSPSPSPLVSFTKIQTFTGFLNFFSTLFLFSLCLLIIFCDILPTHPLLSPPPPLFHLPLSLVFFSLPPFLHLPRPLSPPPISLSQENLYSPLIKNFCT